MTTIDLPGRPGYRMHEPRDLPAHDRFTSRTIYAAAHVVADPMADNDPGRPAALDWESTLAFRRHLWSHGLAVAEAMDTAQRGMGGLDWPTAQELIRRTSSEAAGAPLACGVGTDQLDRPASVEEVLDAYTEQLAVVSQADAVPILMCSRSLAAAATGPEDYLSVYGRLLERIDRPAILHWLGPMFDPALTGYWGSTDVPTAADTLVQLIESHAPLVDGVKISLLDAAAEIALRRRLPEGVRCYTGDDFNYPSLIAGDEHGYSHALLGIFDPLAAFAAAAVTCLDSGDVAGFRSYLDPTVELARKVFESPTFNYKTGVVFLAWLSGHQSRFRMVGGRETARSADHLVDVFVAADRIGLFADPDLAAGRMRALLKDADR